MTNLTSEHESLKHIANYDLLDPIGLGGMSSVFRAQEHGTDRMVAIKVMNQRLAAIPEFRDRFLAQAQQIAALDHPHIVRVYEAAADDDLLYMVMEHFDGVSLRTRINEYLANQQLLELREVVSICRQVAQALHFAHERGLVHRDVKPDNVLIKTSAAMPAGIHASLTDFGLLKRIIWGDSSTGGIEILGTPAYMSPEQARGWALDGRSDVYSLGIMLYELVTGQQPFPAASINEAILMQSQGDSIKVQELRPNVPPALISIILRALRLNPDDRYESAADIGRELEALEKSIKQLEAETIRPFPPLPTKRKIEHSSGAPTVFDVMPVLDQPALPVDLISGGTDDLILLTPPDAPPRTVVLDRPTLSVGRDLNNDLILTDPLVSRRHISIERLPDGRLAVTDAGTMNGTYLNDVRLAKKTTAVWSDGQSVKIGSTWLTLRLARTPIGVGRRQMSLTPAAPKEISLGKQTKVRVTPLQSVIEPGRAVVIRIDVENQHTETQSYRFSLEGLDDSWYTIAPLPLNVPARLSSERLITLHPPRLPMTTPAMYSYKITVSSQDEQAFATADCVLLVYPYYEFASDASVSGRGIRIQLANQGNEVRYYVIETREPSNMLIIAPARVRVSVKAGESGEQALRVQPKNRPWLGTPHHYPVEVYVRSDGLPPQFHTLEYEVEPLFTWWAVTIAIILAISVLLYVLTIIY
ncbi:MAG: protein kinase [Anaerolineae bacterium]|nr:protein kinase [Anaerolineae bacterium]